MLKTPDEHTSRILALADFIGRLTIYQYNQAQYGSDTDDGDIYSGRCICGWTNVHFRKAKASDSEGAADYLGLDRNDLRKLFAGVVPRGDGTLLDNPTPAHAARVLRHLAVTGEVDWSPHHRDEAALENLTRLLATSEVA